MIKIVTIHNFYTSCTNRIVRELFGEMLLIKREGYGPDYPDSFLPVDASDFIATHHLFCLETNGYLEPVAALRHCVQSVCDPYHITSPLLALVEDSRSQLHIDRLRNLIEQHRLSGRQLISSGGFTIKKSRRADRELSTTLKELVVTMMCDDHQRHGNATLIGGGVIRFKTEQLWKKSGYVALEGPDGPLPPVGVATANGEQVLLMAMSAPSEWALECHDKHRSLLAARVTLTAENVRSVPDLKIAA